MRTFAAQPPRGPCDPDVDLKLDRRGDAPQSHPDRPDTLARSTMLALAREAGFAVTLEARIGTETYESITGSLAALERLIGLAQHASRTTPSCSQ
ncbi:hypothetical protein [Burkholderia sp. MBR-1]|uniref:hypothetical protein n=1 Tax=Burkholderia sp. MBR-1 TaxID=2732364 RepID=UPI0015EF25B1|nr:hypothetical protein [Burkholderia sp. MBR-1]QMI49972.1 hypothetical protein MBR110_31490 [Burkholderia sp. MBR-1]